MKEKVNHLIEAARYAPSGENAQPWHFVWDSKKGFLEVCLNEDRTSSLYDWGNRASYVAIGAAIQNIILAASEIDLNVTYKIFPDKSNKKLVAIISLENAKSKPNELAKFIKDRVTNRKKYKSTSISKKDLDKISETRLESFDGKIKFISNKDDIEILARVGSTNEEIMLGNKTIHNFFFSHVNWTKAEDLKNKVGFYIKTLELPGPAQFGFKLMRKWSRAKILNKIFGFPKIVAAQNANVYKTASAIGLVEAPSDSIEDAVSSGMLIQKMWLEATSLGLQVQPITGILYFALRLKNSEKEGFSENDLIKLDVQYKKVQEIFNVEGTAFFMFRIGYADLPTAQALRFNSSEILTIHD